MGLWEWKCQNATLPQLWFFFNQTFPKCAIWYSSQKLLLDIFKNFNKNVLIWNPMEMEISKRYSYSYDSRYSLSIKTFSACVLWQSSQKCNWKFKFNFKKILKCFIAAMGKWKIANILEIANRRVKRSEIWDGLGGSCNMYMEWPLVFKVTLVSFSALVWK